MRQPIVEDLRSKTKDLTSKAKAFTSQGQGQGLHKVSSRRLEAKNMASRTSSLTKHPT